MALSSDVFCVLGTVFSGPEHRNVMSDTTSISVLRTGSTLRLSSLPHTPREWPFLPPCHQAQRLFVLASTAQLDNSHTIYHASVNKCTWQWKKLTSARSKRFLAPSTLRHYWYTTLLHPGSPFAPAFPRTVIGLCLPNCCSCKYP